jgi:hypothetical protein
MTVKEQALELISHLPDDVSVSDIMVCLSSIPAVIEADDEIDRGLGTTHEDVMSRLRSAL